MAVTGTEIISSIEESKSECLLAIQAARDSLNTTLNEYSNKDDNSIHKTVVSEITDVIQQQFKLIENVLSSKIATVGNTTALERKLKTYIDETETKYKEYLSFLDIVSPFVNTVFYKSSVDFLLFFKLITYQLGHFYL